MARLGSHESGISILKKIIQQDKKVSAERATRIKLEVRDNMARTKMMNRRREFEYKNALLQASKYLDTGTIEEKRALRELKMKKRMLEVNSRVSYMMENIYDTFEVTENMGNLSTMITNVQQLFSSPAINIMNPKQLKNNVQNIAQRYETTMGHLDEFESMFDSVFSEVGLELEGESENYLDEINEVRRFQSMQEGSVSAPSESKTLESVNQRIQELRELNELE